MVVVPSRSTGRGQELDQTDRSQGLLYRTTSERSSRTHRPHPRARMARDQERKPIQLLQGYQSTSTRNRLCCMVGSVLVWSAYDWLFDLFVCSPQLGSAWANFQPAKCWSLGQRCFQYEPWKLRDVDLWNFGRLGM
jgi:hypothetical protein